jgi:hypothetical protein
MSKPTKAANAEMECDLVLRDVWRAKDELSAARRHNIDKLFAGLRKREKKSGHSLVNLQAKPRKT